MAETRPEFGRAVSDALGWMGVSPETAGPVLGINARTITAMSQGIVPMRSLIIRFATAVARQCERAGGAPEWWTDVDAWLNVAGYPPRREVVSEDPAPPNGPPAEEPPPFRPLRQASASPPADPPSGAPAPNVPPASPDAPPAKDYYRPVYERMPVNDSFAHIFWIVDRDDRKVFQMVHSPRVDYKSRAAEVKRDLEALTREQFERKYGRFRVHGQRD